MIHLCFLRKLTAKGFDYDRPDWSFSTPRILVLEPYSDYSDIDPAHHDCTLSHATSQIDHQLPESLFSSTTRNHCSQYNPTPTTVTHPTQQPHLIFDKCSILSACNSPHAHLSVFGLPDTHAQPQDGSSDISSQLSTVSILGKVQQDIGHMYIYHDLGRSEREGGKKEERNSEEVVSIAYLQFLYFFLKKILN